MFSTIDFINRHKRKIAAGTVAAVATAYGAKRLMESTAFNDFVRQPFSLLQKTEDQQRDECLVEERLKLMIEMNQQACDKILYKIAVQLKVKLDQTFDTDSLLEELSTPELDAKRKIEIWERLKVLSLSKIFSAITIFSLVTIVLKAQRTILCQIACTELLQNTKQGRNNDASSIYNDGIKLLKSFFYDDIECSGEDIHQQSTTSKINLNKNVQIIFCDSIQYLLTEGLTSLLQLIEQICLQIFEKINLAEKFNFMDFHFLLEQTIAKIKKIGEEKNFSNFVVPREKLNLSALNPVDRQNLENLFSQLLLILHSKHCRTLMDELINKYFDNILKFLDDILIEGTSLQFAKLIPKICQLFGSIVSTNKNSIFCSALSSEELKQFVQFIMDGNLLEQNEGIFAN
ncbi:hypothetical protein ACQ4LE_006361 [Meloidogyne hapla]|uniref:Peroxisomal biogenesis factor 3 n=1 Tax=Meloidogyne hapla TaxID=6305 RepID=A0A1I8BKD7_MELHA